VIESLARVEIASSLALLAMTGVEVFCAALRFTAKELVFRV